MSRRRWFAVTVLFLTILPGRAVRAAAAADDAPAVPAWVTFPEKEWVRITPEQAGLDAAKLQQVLDAAKIGPGGFGGNHPTDKQWGAVLTRGGYLVQTWGDPSYKYQSASLGKCITRALVGLTVERGLIKMDEPISKYWTGKGELSHPHKYLDAGHHAKLTWAQLLNHQGGFVLESGWHWRQGSAFNAALPQWAKHTGDPSFDNYAHTEPGKLTYYSSGGYWRLGQALTAVWKKDLKKVLDEELFGKIGIRADRWEWTAGKSVHDTKDFYPELPGYGEYVDPPYEIGGQTVRGAPGWVVMSPEDLARFGLLVATRGVWKGERLIGPEWLRGHAGLDIHVVAGDPETYVSIGKINTKNFPFGTEVGTGGNFSFPKELITGPPVGAAGR